MYVSYEGVGRICATFLGGGLTEGQVVKLTANGTVGACSADDVFCGVALCCKEDACAVQVGGFVTAEYSGAAPALGWTALAADGKGGVKAAAGGVNCLVVDVDPAAGTVTMMI